MRAVQQNWCLDQMASNTTVSVRKNENSHRRNSAERPQNSDKTDIFEITKTLQKAQNGLLEVTSQS